MRFITLIVITVAVTITACGAPRPEPAVGITAGRGADEYDSLAAGATADTSESPVLPDIVVPERDPYTMSVGDVLLIKFFYYRNYDMTLIVRPDGMVTVPPLGEVRAEGMRPSELEDLIREGYTEILAEPEVSVIVAEFGNQRVFVFGEVNDPGVFDLKGRLTVLDAVAQAGGLTYNGRSDSIILIREGPDGKFGGTRVNLQDLLAGRTSENMFLKPSDVVYVPMTFIAKVNVFVDQFFDNITPTWLFFMYGREVLNPEGRYIIGR